MELTSLGEEMLSLLAKEDELRGFLHQRRTGQDVHPLVIGISSLLTASPAESVLIPVINGRRAFSICTTARISRFGTFQRKN